MFQFSSLHLHKLRPKTCSTDVRIKLPTVIPLKAERARWRLHLKAQKSSQSATRALLFTIFHCLRMQLSTACIQKNKSFGVPPPCTPLVSLSHLPHIIREAIKTEHVKIMCEKSDELSIFHRKHVSAE